MKSLLHEVSVQTSASAEDAVGALLEKVLGIVPSVHIDVIQGTVRVQAYGEWSPDQVPTLRRSLRQGLAQLIEHGVDPGPSKIRIRRVPPRDWSESWKRHFKPFVVGDHLWVKPPWSRRRPRRDQVEVILNPGLSFGTGQHPTTRYCLRELVRLRPGPAVATTDAGVPSFMDLGTGSGLLAIAAACLGYAPIEALDFDPDSVRIAMENAERNGVANRLTLAQADVLKLPVKPTRRFDIVAANLMADLLVEARRQITSRVAPAGHLVVAGILTTQFDTVVEAYRADGWELLDSIIEDEWRSGTFIRTNPR